MNSIITIGITGGIGTGKSLVCRILNIMGYPVFYSDEEAKAILENDPEAVADVKALLGNEAYTNNRPDRKFIASKVFNNPTLLEALNKIIHPRVRTAFEKWRNLQAPGPVFNEAAILFETGAYRNNTFNILVTSPQELRIKRIQARDHITAEQAQQRMASQWTDEQKIALADFVIRNNETELLVPQVIALLEQIRKK